MNTTLIDAYIPGLTQEQKAAGAKVCVCAASEDSQKNLCEVILAIEAKYPTHQAPRTYDWEQDKFPLLIEAIRNNHLKTIQSIIDRCVCP